jgi:signal transduction histidine kinase
VTDIGRVALAARVFTIAALIALGGLAGAHFLIGAGLVALTAAVALAVGQWTRTPQWQVALGEGCVVAALVVVVQPDQGTVTPYLVIPALIAGLDGGRRGLVRVVVAEFGLLVVAWAAVVQHGDRAMALSGFTWLSVSVGIGVIGVDLRRALTSSESESSYRSAVALIRRLDALSEKLSGGLDPVRIAEEIMMTADTVLPTRAAVVLVRSSRGGAVAALRYSVGATPVTMSWAEDLAESAWELETHVLQDKRVALPLQSGDEVVAVLVIETLQPVDGRTARELAAKLDTPAVQLQAALLFGRVRDSAMSQERQRIAREVHDGVAQDVASLGYLVDNIAGTSRDPAQKELIAQLRAEVSRVVGDLRHSIFDLRQEIPSGSGLGESLSAYANQVAALSPMAVHVTVDEEGPRLPRDVEFELMRIAQEAMANARKHSGAANLWLKCTVRSPYAEIEVGDDGTRPHAPAADSHGMKIMRERSVSIGADLSIEAPTPERPGTRVLIRVGRAHG